MQNIKINCWIIFLKRFPVGYFYRQFILFQLCLFINGLIMKLFLDVIEDPHNSVSYHILKASIIFVFGIYCTLF